MPETLKELYCSNKGLREMGECKFLWKMRIKFLPENLRWKRPLWKLM
jgi:hypothetical protein